MTNDNNIDDNSNSNTTNKPNNNNNDSTYTRFSIDHSFSTPPPPPLPPFNNHSIGIITTNHRTTTCCQNCQDAKEYLEKPSVEDLYSVKWEIMQTIFAVAVFFAAAANSPWKIILPLCIALIIVSLLVVVLDGIKIYRVREIRMFPMILLITDLIIVVIDCGITALWDDIENGKYDATITGVAWALDSILVVMSVSTVVGRLMLRARDRKRRDMENELAIELDRTFFNNGIIPTTMSTINQQHASMIDETDLEQLSGIKSKHGGLVASDSVAVVVI
jgi:hypothetical protein